MFSAPLPRLTLAVFSAIAVASVAPSATASPPVVTFDLINVPAIATPSNQTHVLSLRYAVSGPSLQNARIALDLPPGVIPVGISKGPPFRGGCDWDPPDDPNHPDWWTAGREAQDWHCVWTAASLNVPAGGTSGEIRLAVIFRRWGFAHGSTVALSPVFSAEWDNAGTTDAIDPLTNSHSVTLFGTASPAISPGVWGISELSYGYATIATETGDITGIRTQLQIHASNDAAIGISAGYRIRVDLPAGAVYAGHHAHTGAFTTTQAVGTSGTLDFESALPLGVMYASPGSDPGTGDNLATNILELPSHTLVVDVLIPCADYPMPANSHVAASLLGNAPGISPPGEQLLATGNLTAGWGLTSAPWFACGLPSRTELSVLGGNVAISRPLSLLAHMHGPTGAVPVRDGFLSFWAPSIFRGLDASLDLPAARPDGHTIWDNGFELWTCNLPTVASPLTRAQFEIARDANHCTMLADGELRQPWPAGALHVVAYGRSDIPWVFEGDIGPTVHMPVGLRVSGLVGGCMDGATEAAFSANVHVEASDGNIVTTASQELELLAPATHAPGWIHWPNPATAARGQPQVFTYVAGGYFAPLRNPTVAITVPEGVAIRGVRAADFGPTPPGCVTMPIQWAVVGNVLTITTGTEASPWYHDPGCDRNGCSQGGPLRLEVETRFLGAHPFRDGHEVSFTATIRGDNPHLEWPAAATDSHHVTVRAPAGKLLVQEPICIEIDGLVETGFRTRFENSGGLALPDVEIDVPIPQVGDGSGTEVNSRLKSVTTTLGMVTCSADGVLFGPVCDEETVFVRVSVASLAPGEHGSLSIFLANDEDVVVGAAVRPRATMRSGLLLPLDAVAGPPILWGVCPGRVTVRSWFDSGAEPGLREATEDALDGWVIRFTDTTVPANTFAMHLAPTGHTTLAMAPGRYTLMAIPAQQSPEAAWTYELPLPPAVTVSAAETVVVELAAVCSCPSDDACTSGTCEEGGICNYRRNDDDPTCVIGCGNGRIDPGEQCDTGSHISLDAGCLFCGCAPIGFTFDAATQGCRPICGDNIRVGDEECDDGNRVDGDGCNSDCRIPAGSTCERPADSGCPNTSVCGESRAPWCQNGRDTMASDEGGADWCVNAREEGINGFQFCAFGPDFQPDCATFDPSCVDRVDWGGAGTEEDDICIISAILCHACEAIGPDTCTVWCVPDMEICDGVDNDCDALVDEGFDLGATCTAGVADCFNIGVTICGADAGAGCTADAPIDLDRLGDACTLTVGGCAVSGTQTCRDSNGTKAVTCVADPDQTVDSDNDGVADVCDCAPNDSRFLTMAPNIAGSRDEDGDGYCNAAIMAVNRALCVSDNGQGGSDCDDTVAAIHPGAFERCNTLDDNCDGAIDEGFDVGVACSTGLGMCHRDGVRACTDNGNAACTATQGVPSAEVCNGRDDDCDGIIDGSALDNEGSVCPNIDTAITTGPVPMSGATTAVFTYNNPFDLSYTAFECSFDGGPWFGCPDGALTLTDVEVGQHTLLVKAVHGGGGDPTPAAWAWTVDTNIPETRILLAPEDPSDDKTAHFVFSATIADVAGYFCALDPIAVPPATPADFTPCDAAVTFTDLGDGEHHLWVYAVAATGVADPTPLLHTWHVRISVPETVITSAPTAAPGGATRMAHATFTFESPDGAAALGFVCRFDDGAPFGCSDGTAATEGLTDGVHAFQVQATNNRGIADPTPATWSWVVDTRPPDTFILSGPDEPSQSGSGIFVFRSDEDDVTYACALVAGDAAPVADAWDACLADTPFEGLSDGIYTMWVTATDSAGNSDPTPGQWTWHVDATFPDTVVTAGPDELAPFGSDATFAFSSRGNVVFNTFDCKVDGEPWRACDGGTLTVPGDALAVGPHDMEVRTCSRMSGVCDPSPARWAWEVGDGPCPSDRAPPTLSCQATVALACTDGSAHVDLQTFWPIAEDNCAPVSVTAVVPDRWVVGANPVVFVGRDGNNNRATCLTVVDIRDTVAPEITCPADIVAFTSTDACSVDLTLENPSVHDVCSGSTVQIASDSPATFGRGETEVTMSVTDGAGNTAACTMVVRVVDDIPLDIACPPELTLVAPPDVCGHAGGVSASASDNCAAASLVVRVDRFLEVGAQDVVFADVDEAGNEGTCTSRVVVRDETPPTVSCGSRGEELPAVVTTVVNDACDVETVLSDLTCSDAVNGNPVSGCMARIDGGAVIIGGRHPSGTVVVGWTVTARDASGNVTEVVCSETIAGDGSGAGRPEEGRQPDNGCGGGRGTGWVWLVAVAAAVGRSGGGRRQRRLGVPGGVTGLER